MPGAMIGGNVQDRLRGGPDVKEHGSPPVTPAKTAAHDKGRSGLSNEGCEAAYAPPVWDDAG